MSATVLEETTVEDVDLSGALTCGENDCDAVATHRALYICCSDAALLCRMHKNALQRWINLHAKGVSKCSIHGTTAPLKDLLKIYPL